VITAPAISQAYSVKTLKCGAPLMIDSHVHVYRRDPRHPYAPGQKHPEQDATVEMLIDLMHANGVARAVLIQVIYYLWDNSYLLSVLKRYPQLFHGVCRVNPEDPAAPDHLSQLTEEGCSGVRLSPAASPAGDWIRGPLMPSLWRRCGDLKVPMTILTTAPRLPDLIPLLEANPDLTVVIDHMADCPVDRPDLLKLLLDLARYPKVYVKISDLWIIGKHSYPFPDSQDQARRVMDAFGARRVMWSTNWPVSLQELPYAKIVELYRDHLNFVTPEEHHEILSGTVQRVWPFGL
ncbi:MAG TPA: amidohydrolase family protein, partial [Terracidiphilus sp.]